MKASFIYTKELDLGVIAINVNHIVSANKGSVKSTGEEVTMVRLVTGKELVIRLTFDQFRKEIEEVQAI